jgi:ABC-type polysaccharide/polyol phosphate transport system ATPase subunit
VNAIELTNVSKIYRRYSGRQFSTLKSALLQRSLLQNLRPNEVFPALTDVSFAVRRGVTYGVIGKNGSGKSTALKLVAGITKPTTGTVKVEGRISALIELGAGFHPEISGRENVFINGIMLGLTKREVQERFDEIVDFAELREFIDAPVKTYSSGMYMRLGFAVAIHVNPDVLLVDEVLAVGDEGFTHKCLDKFGEFRRRGKTILLVTHSLPLVERFCDEALWLDQGHAMTHGDPKRVVDAYLTKVEEGESELLATSKARAVEDADRDGQERQERQERQEGRNGRKGRKGRKEMTVSKHPRRPTSPGVWRGGGDRERSRSSTSRFSTKTTSRRSYSTPAIRCRFDSSCTRPIRPTISSSASQFSIPMACAVTAPTPSAKTWSRCAWPVTPKSPSPSTASPSSTAPTRSMSPCTSATASRTTIIGCCTRSG